MKQDEYATASPTLKPCGPVYAIGEQQRCIPLLFAVAMLPENCIILITIAAVHIRQSFQGASEFAQL